METSMMQQTGAAVEVFAVGVKQYDGELAGCFAKPVEPEAG
jgi:hypothetical protein